VRNWPRLVGWLEDERGRIRERLRLTEAAEQWLKLGRDPGALLRGTLLDDAQRHPDLNELEQEFVAASLAARQAAAAEREAAHRRELEQARQLATEQERLAASERQWAEYQSLTATKLRQRAWLLGLTTVAALLLAALAIWLSSRASAERQAAVYQAATAAAASTASLEQAATAAAASTESLQQAATANVAQQLAILAQEAAEADAAAARTAEAIAVAEQTKVSLARGALANTVNELSNVLTAVAPPSGLSTTNAITTAAESFAGQYVTPQPLVTPTPPLRVAAPPPRAIITDTAIVRIPITEVEVAGGEATPIPDATPIEPPVEIDGSMTDDNGDNGSDENTSGDVPPDDDSDLNLATATPVTESATVTATVVTTDGIEFLPGIRALVPEISISLYASAAENAERIGMIQGPLSLPILNAEPFAVQVLVLDDPLPPPSVEQTAPTPVARTTITRESTQIGWIQSWQLNYRGDRTMLPPELRHLVIQEQEIPYLQGQVIQIGEEEGYPLLERLTDYTVVTTVPVGKVVTLISAADATQVNATQTDVTQTETVGAEILGTETAGVDIAGTESSTATPNLWYYISVVNPNEENRIWRGYLPAAVIAPLGGE
ncbi:MAG: hypothetical protein KDE47_03540, partial [Caldilineaceae bacterium]|nr:hypothetical protein [Caldilineaceae bacterium]